MCFLIVISDDGERGSGWPATTPVEGNKKLCMKLKLGNYIFLNYNTNILST